MAPVFLSHQGIPVHLCGLTSNLRHAWGLLLDLAFLLGDFFFFATLMIIRESCDLLAQQLGCPFTSFPGKHFLSVFDVT